MDIISVAVAVTVTEPLLTCTFVLALEALSNVPLAAGLAVQLLNAYPVSGVALMSYLLPNVTGEVEPVTEPEEIDDDDTPVAPGEPTWALINLILSIIAVITAIIMAITFFFAKKKEDEDEEQQAQKAPKAEGEEEEEKKKSYKGLKFLGFIPAAAAVILFILTENMHFKMILVDKWTILTAVFAVIAIVIGILTRNKKDKEDEEANGEQA